jgi:hypothetical protein
MQMPISLPTAVRGQGHLDAARIGVTSGLTPAGDAACHAACVAGLAAARAGCAALGPFAPPCLAAAEAAFLYCNTRC